MFARIFTIKLKAGQGSAYATVIEKEVIPLLRSFAGFRDEIAMVSADARQAVGISFWDNAASAEAYVRGGFERVRKMIEPYTDGNAVVISYDVTNSTAHHIKDMVAGAAGR